MLHSLQNTRFLLALLNDFVENEEDKEIIHWFFNTYVRKAEEKFPMEWQAIERPVRTFEEIKAYNKPIEFPRRFPRVRFDALFLSERWFMSMAASGIFEIVVSWYLSKIQTHPSNRVSIKAYSCAIRLDVDNLNVLLHNWVKMIKPDANDKTKLTRYALAFSIHAVRKGPLGSSGHKLLLVADAQSDGSIDFHMIDTVIQEEYELDPGEFIQRFLMEMGCKFRFLRHMNQIPNPREDMCQPLTYSAMLICALLSNPWSFLTTEQNTDEPDRLGLIHAIEAHALNIRTFLLYDAQIWKAEKYPYFVPDILVYDEDIILSEIGDMSICLGPPVLESLYANMDKKVWDLWVKENDITYLHYDPTNPAIFCKTFPEESLDQGE